MEEIAKLAEGRLHPKGHVHVQHLRDGKVIGEQKGDNVTCDNGVTLLATSAMGITQYSGYYTTGTVAAGTFFQYIAIGTGTVAPAHTDSTLTAEVMRTNWSSWTLTTTSTTNDTAQVVASFAFTTTGYTIDEVGLLAQVPAAWGFPNNEALLGHVSFGGSPFVVAPGDVLQVTWNETY